MPTKVFISWSGELSRKLGEALRNWLPASLQYVRPYFTPEDIEKGSKWSTEIAKELECSDVGVICLTQENTEKPWILFEAGALSKSLDKARVCTLLFNLEPAEVKGPLTSFQATRFEAADFKKLVTTINSVAGEAKLEPQVLDSVFAMWWPKLKGQVDEIIKSHDNSGRKERRPDRDILEEVLELTRMNASRGARPRISERALAEIIHALDELMFVMARGGGSDITVHVLQRLNHPLRHLCMDAGLPDMYEVHSKHLQELLRLNEHRGAPEGKTDPEGATKKV